jgi:peptidoglycan/xylan/chitin deacetylase (PgdA/CDA1 family)
MNWPQLRELHQAGMEIGSHTLTHRPPSLLNDAELEYELSESRRVLEDGLGAPVISISSPTGFFNPRMRKIAKETGYRALCIGRIGWARPEGDCFSLNRVAVKRGMSMNAFQALLSFDRLALTTLRSRQWMRELARETLGPTVYLQIRETLLANRIFNRNRA